MVWAVQGERESGMTSIRHQHNMKQLIEAGADPTITDISGKTAIDYAANSSTIKLLKTAEQTWCRATGASSTPKKAVVNSSMASHTLRLRKDALGRVGIWVDEEASPDGSGIRAIFTGVVPSSINIDVGIRKGDVVAAVDGVLTTKGPGAAERCVSLLRSAHVTAHGFPVVVHRPGGIPNIH